MHFDHHIGRLRRRKLLSFEQLLLSAKFVIQYSLGERPLQGASIFRTTAGDTDDEDAFRLLLRSRLI